MKRRIFAICVSKQNENGDGWHKGFTAVEGWIDTIYDGIGIGLRKVSGRWTVTDLKSGLLLPIRYDVDITKRSAITDYIHSVDFLNVIMKAFDNDIIRKERDDLNKAMQEYYKTDAEYLNMSLALFQKQSKRIKV